MTYKDFVKEIAVQSKTTERPLAIDDIRMVFDLTREVLIDALNKGENVTIRDFIKFETKTRKGRMINVVNTDKQAYIPDTIVAKAVLSGNFKNEVKKVCEK